MSTQLNEVTKQVLNAVSNKLNPIEGTQSQNTVEHAVSSYRAIKLQIEALELELKEHRATIEAECFAHENFSFTSGLFKVKLSESSRETCDLKNAKQQLGELLTPFLKTSCFTVLRVS